MADSSEVVVVVDVQAAPSKADEVIAAFDAASTATHEEPGCIVYALHRDNTDPEHFVHVERWASQGDLDAHMQAAHTAALFEFAGTPGNLAKPPALTFASALGLGQPDRGVLG